MQGWQVDADYDVKRLLCSAAGFCRNRSVTAVVSSAYGDCRITCMTAVNSVADGRHTMVLMAYLYSLCSDMPDAVYNKWCTFML